MTAPTVYKSTDANAPVCCGTRTSLIDVLNKCLVTGYGDKLPAGWTLQFVNAGGTQAAFRNNPTTGTGFFLQIDALGGVNDYTPTVRGYEVMVSEGTTDALGFIGGVGGPKVSTGSNTTVRPWVLIADDRFFYFFCWYSSTGGIPTSASINVNTLFFGDFVPFYPDDNYACLLSATLAASDNAAGFNLYSPTQSSSPSAYFSVYTGRRADGSGTSRGGWVVDGGGPGDRVTPGRNGIPYSGKLLYTKPYINDLTSYAMRGFYPGLVYPCHDQSGFTQLQTIDISGDSYLVVVANFGGDNTDRPGCIFLKLSDWWA